MLKCKLHVCSSYGIFFVVVFSTLGDIIALLFVTAHLPFSQHRANVLLLGDSQGDPSMTDGINGTNSHSIIKIGFLNHHVRSLSSSVVLCVCFCVCMHVVCVCVCLCACVHGVCTWCVYMVCV